MRIELYWHTETDDIDLGDAYVDALPPVGALIGYVPERMSEPRPAGWIVVAVQIILAAPGSMAVLHPSEQYGIYHVFVEPAEGPFHP